MGRFSCHFSNKKGRDIGHGLRCRNKKAVGSLKEVPTASNHFNSYASAVDKPLPMAVLPPPVSHVVALVAHLLPANPFSKTAFPYQTLNNVSNGIFKIREAPGDRAFSHIPRLEAESEGRSASGLSRRRISSMSAAKTAVQPEVSLNGLSQTWRTGSRGARPPPEEFPTAGKTSCCLCDSAWTPHFTGKSK
jgi:hypothetical protein